MFSEVCVNLFTGGRGVHAWLGEGGTHGKVCAWLGVCMAGGMCTWLGACMAEGMHVWLGACMAGGMHALWCAWLRGMCGACVVGGMNGWGNAWFGVCMAEGHACLAGWGMCGWGACVSPSVWLTSGRFEWYWNADLFEKVIYFHLSLAYTYRQCSHFSYSFKLGSIQLFTRNIKKI